MDSDSNTQPLVGCWNFDGILLPAKHGKISDCGEFISVLTEAEELVILQTRTKYEEKIMTDCIK